jgi:hypothetical protein
MNFYNDFLCGMCREKTVPFTGSDDKDRFSKSLREQPDDWIYRNKKVRYYYNKHGFRCKNFDEIDLDNYIIFTGCSHTEGVGLALEDTFSYKVSNHLKTDYVNLAIGGTGLDVLEYNLVTWFLKFKKKPKCVFIQWPDHSRYAGVFPKYEHIISIGSWRQEPTFKDFMVAGETSGFFCGRKYLTTKLLSNIIDVPIYSIQFTSLSSYQTYDLFIKKIDTARDLVHAGIKSNENTAKQIIDQLSMR